MIGKVNEAQLLENAVVNQMQPYGKLSFYNRKNVSEIDIVLENKIGFEIKITGTAADEKRLRKTADSLKLKKSFIISRNFREDMENVIYPQFL